MFIIASTPYVGYGSRMAISGSDRKKILSLWNKGLTAQEISRLIGCSIRRVYYCALESSFRHKAKSHRVPEDQRELFIKLWNSGADLDEIVDRIDHICDRGAARSYASRLRINYGYELKSRNKREKI